MKRIEVCVPNIGDLIDGAVIEFLVQVGDKVNIGNPVVVVEVETAVPVPAPPAGVASPAPLHSKTSRLPSGGRRLRGVSDPSP